MEKQLRISALLIVLTCMLTFCHAQQPRVAVFAYDTDGNRLTREILFGRIDVDKSNDEDNEEYLSSATDFFETVEVNLFPNPTCDKFFVEIMNETSKKAEVTLAHFSGTVLEKRIITNSMEEFDLSGYAPGLYLLTITVNNETHNWKVIKKQ